MSCGVVLAALAAGAGVCTNVSFSAAAYAPGEALSEKGTVGGTWIVPAEVMATNVVVDGIGGIAFVTEVTNGCELVASSDGKTNDFRSVDFTIDPELLSYGLDFVPDGIAALSPGKARDGSFCFLGWGDGAWQELGCGGEDVAALRNAPWIDGRMELKTVADVRYVSYLVKVNGAWMRLKSASGQSWFATRHEQTRTTCGVVGTGRLASLSASSDADAAVTTYYWIGGESGDWNVATNWSETAGGEPADRCPAAGDAVRVEGSAALVKDNEAATLSDFLACIQDDGTLELWSGTFKTPVTFDTSRVRAGKKLEIIVQPFGGLSNPIVATWYHAPMATKGAKGTYAQVATGTSYTPQKDDYESWFKCDYAIGSAPVETKEFFFSKLPLVYLATDSGNDPPTDKTKVKGTIRVQGNDEFKSPIESDMPLTINVRGNTTASKTKKPWKLKLEEKTKMFGLGGKSSKHWVLLANAMDPSGYRNKLAYDFANEIGGFAMQSTFVSVFMNGTYRGVYQFCQHVRIAEDRVNIYDWESAGEDVAKTLAKSAKLPDEAKDVLKEEMSTNFQWVTSGQVAYDGVTYDLGEYVKDFASYTNDISGGYLFELDNKSGDELTKFSTTKTGQLASLPVAVSSPETLYTNTKMVNKGKSILNTFFAATTAVDGYNGDKHFSELADMNSLVAYYLAMELTGNYDAKMNSRFAYVDRGGPLMFGPVWDCDLAFASPDNSFDTAAHNPERWIVLNSDTAFYKEWIDDPHFCTLVRDCWLKTARQAYSNMLAKVETWNVELAQPFAADEKRWPSSSASYKMATDRANLVDFITRRLAWVDEQFADVPTMMASLRSGTGSKSSTNPYDKSAGETAAPIALQNAEDGRVLSGTSLRVFVGTGASPEGVTLYVNGLKFPTTFRAVEGGLLARVPSSRLRVESEGANTIEVIIRSSDGKTVVARNYALVVRDPKSATTLLIVR